MKAIDNVGVTFVNVVLGRGILNGVVNLQFGTFGFTPADDGKTVELDPMVSCRMRMDRVCAQQLHETLGTLLEAIEKTEAEVVTGKAPEAPQEKPH